MNPNPAQPAPMKGSYTSWLSRRCCTTWERSSACSSSWPYVLSELTPVPLHIKRDYCARCEHKACGNCSAIEIPCDNDPPNQAAKAADSHAAER